MQEKNIVSILKMFAHDDVRIKVHLQDDITSGQYELNEILDRVVSAIELEKKEDESGGE
ncbi:hypothetical protein SAMN05660297_01935 [Natronincola peptidivorans]|uniref:Uncharacterized protein n=1 Tax=Natronincola peptidivorans TaxID=426128 RepID=A0A1I0DA95_9FIRM|nr:hypothetical protein [Natronincola peptidivorans]SET29021.1 hypothetical protein SAMN05660297_01935 [Natronincola peptidivorans]